MGRPGPRGSSNWEIGGCSAPRGSRWRSGDRGSGGHVDRRRARRDRGGRNARSGAPGAGGERIRTVARGSVPGVSGARRGPLADRRRSRRAAGDDHARVAEDHPARGSQPGGTMSQRLRLLLFGAGALGLAVVLAWGFAGLPSFGDFDGRYGKVLAHSAVPQIKATSAVGATTLDYRGFDTLVEEFILFTAAVWVVVLLRVQRAE